MTETPKEFLLKQIHFATSTKIGPHIIFNDDEDRLFCPYCGKELRASLSGGYSVKCDCKDYQDDLATLTKIDEINTEIDCLVKQKKDISNYMNNRVAEAGMKLCAKHYVEKKKEREDFDSKIEEFAK